MKDRVRLEIGLLGRLEVRAGARRLEFPTRHAGFLIAVLALEGPMLREVVAARLWGERADAQARASLRQTIYNVQKVLAAAGAAELETDRMSVALRKGSFLCDATGLPGRIASDPAGAARAFRADLLGDTGRIDPAFEDWLTARRAGFGAHVAEGLHGAADRLAAGADWPALAAVADGLLRHDRFDQAALRHRMRALAGQGQRAPALEEYDRFRTLLADEMQGEPDAATAALRDRIAADEAAQ